MPKRRALLARGSTSGAFLLMVLVSEPLVAMSATWRPPLSSSPPSLLGESKHTVQLKHSTGRRKENES